MFNKILIANRGEIACRIIRTCHQRGVSVVAVYSDADRHAQHVRQADEAVHLGPAPARDSYLRGEAIIAAAQRTGAQAVHPGYGFLSENPDFARACADAGLVFIGPPAEAIDAMGSKSAAKRIMENAGVPLVPGYHGADQDLEKLRAAAEDIGYPVMLKAVHGGGGKGMRIVEDPADFDSTAAAARREGESAFGNGDLLVEKCVLQPRHVEIQVFTDRHGHGLYLAERDCSVQRRHQKVIEEAPAPGMTPELRRAMGEAAVRAAQAIDYVGAGTVEFLLDRDHSFYFMEMNTRLQVEHPVTEMITGQDLVAWQLQVAAGEPLPLRQEDVVIRGHAVEARIYAEDADNGFLPATGTLSCLRTPSQDESVRIDTGVIEGDEVSIHYDPMIAKLIVHADSREAALQRLTRALADYHVDGVVTNIPFLHRLAGHPAFVRAELDTGFIDRYQEDLLNPEPLDVQVMSTLAAALHVELLARERSHSTDPWDRLTGWRLNGDPQAAVEVEHDGGVVSVARDSVELWPQIQALSGHQVRIERDGRADRFGWYATGTTPRRLTLFADGRPWRGICQPAEEHLNAGVDDEHSLSAPMNGTVVSILVEQGQAVEAGQALLVMEAMKMEHSVKAPSRGTVEQVWFRAGDTVTAGSELLAFVPAEESEQ